MEKNAYILYNKGRRGKRFWDTIFMEEYQWRIFLRGDIYGTIYKGMYS